MLRFTTRNRMKVSSRLAIFAAVMLLVSSLMSLEESMLPGRNSALQMAGPTQEPIEQTTAQAQAGNALSKSKGFRMSLFLFRVD